MASPLIHRNALVLSTLNARYIHASLGLRYLRANLGPWREQSVIEEFTIQQDADLIVTRLLAHNPTIIGLGVYVWNVEASAVVLQRLRARAPQVIVILGGPEVSHPEELPALCTLADYVVCGWGDITLRKLVTLVLERSNDAPLPATVDSHPPMHARMHAPRVACLMGERPPLDAIALPYDEYTDDDIAHRLIYVEASRGCPFRCEFCLSALDQTAWPFALEPLLASLDQLHQRGARVFKFVDRTFNLKAQVGARILSFFFERLDEKLFLHFEMIPDRLPDELKEWLARFPPGSVQLEIGIQSWNPVVQTNISRRQNDAAAEANLRFLRTHTGTHLHTDLIFGLPGETLESFAAGFNRLHALHPHEIQLGMLKRLRGAPIARHTKSFEMVYDEAPPYEIRANRDVSADMVQRVARFAKYWDRVANSGRFPRTLPMLLGDDPFAHFMQFSDWVYMQLQRTHSIDLGTWFELLHSHLVARCQRSPSQVPLIVHALRLDFEASRLEARLSFLHGPKRGPRTDNAVSGTALRKRQLQHHLDHATPAVV